MFNINNKIFPSRNNENNEIIQIFDKLFVYNSTDPIKNIDTKLFHKDFREIVEEVECPICLFFPLNPVQCSKCQKLLCKTCQIKKECAICRDKFEEKELDRNLKNILEKLLVKCQNCDKYSKSFNKVNKIKVSEYIKHISNCEYSDYQCLICKKIIPHSKQKCLEHAHFCGYRDTSCCYCLKTIKTYLLKEHEMKCGEELVPCEFCESKYERKKIANHKKNLCQMRIVKCNDCKESYKFKDFNAHLKEECKDNQIKYWKTKFEEAKKVLEEDFNFECNEKNLTIRKQRTLERQNTEVNLFSNLSLDSKFNQTERIRVKKPLNPFSESKIVKDKDIIYIYEFFKGNNDVNFSLIYQMTKDGENSFHSKCDNKGATLSLFKIKKNSSIESYNRLGGFTSVNWDCSNQVKKDQSAFIFSLTRKKMFKAMKPFYSIYCSLFYGPCFGFSGVSPGLWNKGKNGGYNLTETYGDSERDCTCGLKEYFIEEIEVYKVSFGDFNY